MTEEPWIVYARDVLDVSFGEDIPCSPYKAGDTLIPVWWSKKKQEAAFKDYLRREEECDSKNIAYWKNEYILECAKRKRLEWLRKEMLK